MKAKEVIESFCYLSDIEGFMDVKVPEFDNRKEYVLWAMGYFGFVPNLRQGEMYVFAYVDDLDEEPMCHPSTGVIPASEVVIRQEEGDVVKFYHVES